MTNRRRFIRPDCITSALLLVFAGSGFAVASAEEPDTAAASRWIESSEDLVARGRATFGTCVGCHGDDAAGRIGIGPRIASKTYLAAASDDFLVSTIKQGRAGTTMIPWNAILKDEQVEGVVAYLRSIEPSDPVVLDESPLHGNLDNGARIFRDICSGCHGRSGAGYQETANGTGIGRRAFLDTASNGFIRYIVSEGKSQTMMRGFAAKNVTAVANLTAQDIDDTISYLRANAW